MDLDKLINKRFSARKFYSKVPNWRDIIDAIECGSKIPYAGGIQNIKFILIDDQEKIIALKEAAQQNFIQNAHYVVAVVSDPTNLIRSYDEFGEIYTRQQAGAAIEQFLLKLVEKGLAGCWVGSYVEDHVKKILSIPSHAHVEAIIPIGYAWGKPIRKRQPYIDKVTFFNKYGQKTMKPKKKVEAF